MRRAVVHPSRADVAQSGVGLGSKYQFNRRGGGLPYVDLSHGASSSFLSFLGFLKRKFFFPPSSFFYYTRTRFSYFLSTICIWVTSTNCSIPFRDFYKA